MNIHNISNLEKDYIELAIGIGNNMGIDTLSSNIIAILQISDKPISMEEIAKKTGYSLTSVFNKLKNFELFRHQIKKIKEPGSKKALFYIEKNMPQTVKNTMLNIYQKKILPAKTELPKIIKKYENHKLSEKDKKIILEIKNYNKQVNLLEKKVKKIIELFENGK